MFAIADDGCIKVEFDEQIVPTKIVQKGDKIAIGKKAPKNKWMYKIRYYRYLPIDKENCVKDVVKLEDKFQRIIKLIIKKAQEFKIWDVFSEDTELTYRILKEVFNTKIIYLQNINFQCRNDGKTLYVEIYDDNVIEGAVKFEVGGKVTLKKKIKLFT